MIKDQKDKDAYIRRLKQRPAHLERAHSSPQIVVIGGAILSSEDDGQMCGSMMVLEMPSRDACMDWINNDPYVHGRVWDLDSMQLYPFRTPPKTSQ